MLTISSIGNEETDDRKNANSVGLSGRRPAQQRLGIPVAWISHLSQTALDLDQSTSAGVTGAGAGNFPRSFAAIDAAQRCADDYRYAR